MTTQRAAMATHGRKLRHFNAIGANGGQFYVRDCQPWNIKEGCQRMDCPMRKLAIAPEAAPDDYLLDCKPVGDLADLLILLQRTGVRG